MVEILTLAILTEVCHVGNWFMNILCYFILIIRRRRLPDLEGSCEYIEWAVADSRQGAFLQGRRKWILGKLNGKHS